MEKNSELAPVLSGIGIYKICSTLHEVEKNLPIEVVPPVWGSDMSAFEYFSHMRPRVEAGRGLLLPGELGATLAHLSAYQRIISSKQPGLILEDDIVLESRHILELQKKLPIIAENDFVHFAKYRHPHGSTCVGNGVSIPDTSHGFWGAAAYLISTHMAEYLVEWHRPFIDKADNWQEIFVDNPFVPVEIPIFTHSGEVSNIGDRSNPPQHPSAKQGLMLRLWRLRMRYFARLRHRRHVRAYLSSKKVSDDELDN